jgi:hypothetical protein
MSRTNWADDFDEIRRHRERIRAEEQPRCPTNASMTLYACLRSPSRCGESCPYKADWLGPQPT